jgi:hypothetical protein
MAIQSTSNYATVYWPSNFYFPFLIDEKGFVGNSFQIFVSLVHKLMSHVVNKVISINHYVFLFTGLARFLHFAKNKDC